MELITVAHLAKIFGLKGEIHAFSLTDFPEERFKKGRVFLLQNPKTLETQEVTLTQFRAKGDSLVLKFKEFNSAEEASAIQNFDLTLKKEDAPLKEGYYRLSDLKGCKVLDEEGNLLGEVVEVTSYAPTKNLRIKKENGKCFYCPFIDEFVKDVNIEAKTLVIHVMEGLL